MKLGQEFKEEVLRAFASLIHEFDLRIVDEDLSGRESYVSLGNNAAIITVSRELGGDTWLSLEKLGADGGVVGTWDLRHAERELEKLGQDLPVDPADNSIFGLARRVGTHGRSFLRGDFSIIEGR